MTGSKAGSRLWGIRAGLILLTAILVFSGIATAAIHPADVCVFTQDANYRAVSSHTVRDNFRMYGECMNFTGPNQIGQDTGSQYITPTYPKAKTVTHLSFIGTPFKALKLPARCW